MEKVYRKATEGERVVIEVESFTRPGLVYRVQLFGKGQHHCPCLGHHHTGNCRHITEARIRTAPYRIARTHSNLFGTEYAVIEQATGRVMGCQPSYGDAFALVRELSGGRAA